MDNIDGKAIFYKILQYLFFTNSFQKSFASLKRDDKAKVYFLLYKLGYLKILPVYTNSFLF